MNSDAAREFWDQRYAGDAYRFGQAPNAFLARQAGRLKPGMKALAVADGEGRNGVWLARQGLEVLSTDISSRALEKARALALRNGVTVDARLADLDAWDWPVGTMDVAVAIFIQFSGPEGRARHFQALKAALKPGGLLLLEGYRPEQIAYGTGGPGVVENLYTEAMLRDAFADFEILDLAVYDAELTEGDAHAGPSALIDLVARKPG